MRAVTPGEKGKSTDDIVKASVDSKQAAEDKHMKISQASQAVLRGLRGLARQTNTQSTFAKQ